jgi:hypothetical protein
MSDDTQIIEIGLDSTFTKSAGAGIFGGEGSSWGAEGNQSRVHTPRRFAIRIQKNNFS